MSTLSTLAAAQSARFATLPQRISDRFPPRQVALELPRQRNAALDAFFYDVDVLSAEEVGHLAPDYAREGAILRLGPSARPTLETWATAEEFLAAGGGGAGEVAALAVAGVGSSALGAAAFARNVADALDAPVLAVVSGYGISDLMTEAMGGFFLFGWLNAARHAFEPWDDLTSPFRDAGSSSIRLAEGLVRRSLDVVTLLRLLESPLPIARLIGHSKGNLVIAEALDALSAGAPERLAERAAEVRVVTVSARIAMPQAFARVTHVMGALDNFGEMNSRRWIGTDRRVAGAWHHTNTQIPLSLHVTREIAPVL